MSQLTDHILATAAARPAGELLSPKEFLHLGSRAAVDQALSRLAREGRLMRIGRGAYGVPVASRFGNRPPAPAEVVASIAHKTGEIVTEHGAAAANQLGLTTQVPVREVFLTSGRGRQLTFGAQKVTLKHAPGWQLLHHGRPAGRAIRALTWLGPAHTGAKLAVLRKQLPQEEWQALVDVRAALPSWLAKAIGEASLHA